MSTAVKVLDSDLIKKVFSTMEYSSEDPKLDEAEEHVSGQTETHQSDLRESSSFTRTRSVEDKIIVMQKLADRLDEEIDSIARIEKESRQIPISYTERSVKFIIDSLRNYAPFLSVVETRTCSSMFALSSKCSLSLLAYVLGYTTWCRGMAIVAPIELMNTMVFIKKLMLEAGIPSDALSLHEKIEDVGPLENVINKTCFDLKATDDFKWDQTLSLSFPTRVVILEDADLDSACECVLDPWNNVLCINDDNKEVFVQESIYDTVCGKLQEGGYEKSVAAFRTANEALKLVNNTGQGLSVSIWTESNGLAHYAAKHLDVANVWINCFGIYSPQVPFYPRKLSGNGYFGFRPSYARHKGSLSSSSEFSKLLAEAKKAQVKWSRLPRYRRVAIVREILNKFQTSDSDISPHCILEGSIAPTESSSSFIDNYNLTIQYEPKGVLIMGHPDVKFLVSGLIEGNAIITCDEKLVVSVKDQLPEGVVNLFLQKEPSADWLYASSDSDKVKPLPFLQDCCWDFTFKYATISKNVWSAIG